LLREASTTCSEKEAMDGSNRPECRGKPRIRVSFPAHVRGIDQDGEEFALDLLLENLSASGLYLHLPRKVRSGTRLFTVIYLSAGGDNFQAARVATRGVVVRTELRPDGTYGVGVVFSSSRFLGN